ncbi:hypothetical protein ONS95_003080 [Cadophora gregata]|uniref:uncharacterized protein n=1 Tax=Cadophora gregata TaxID=51156 RepID=UPI0026DA71AB|nr:uncharacterized protein ONS95_003080 [Cadophora gregata]KAK0108263.1 hypothetical protein ONS95_003080 [Cadophora gregata]KAK0109147.1 hypothetical protein ONS96_002972 [Cadophora gregata f. sp. sojae]
MPPPPPVTPSPHRFVIKKERPPVRSTPLAQEHTPRPSTQFNSTPRFTFSSTPRPTASQTLPPPRFTPSTARFVTPASRKLKNHDAIELSSDDGLQEVHDSIETEEQEIDYEGYQSGELEDDYKLEEPSPKRRRFSTSSQTWEEEQYEDQEEMLLDENDNTEDTSSSLPILSSPPAPRRPISTTAPRFLLSTPAPQSTHHDSHSLSTQNPLPTPFLKPPRFRPPDPSSAAQAQSDPLPDQFSPHRKGQKYIPGGLAAEVRDWLMNLEGAIPDMRGKRRDEEWLVKIMVDEVSGGSKEGMTMVRGRQIHTVDVDVYGEVGEMVDTVGEVKVILAGEGAGTGLQKGSAVEVGKMVGIKGPVWEIVVEGVKWGVGVDWKVLR